jgi:hypothetical protein
MGRGILRLQESLAITVFVDFHHAVAYTLNAGEVRRSFDFALPDVLVA